MVENTHVLIDGQMKRIHRCLWCLNAAEVRRGISCGSHTADLMNQLMIGLDDLADLLGKLANLEHLSRRASNIAYMAGDSCVPLRDGNFGNETTGEVEHVLTVTLELLEEVSAHLARSELPEARKPT